METMQSRTNFSQGKSHPPIFELNAAELEAVSGGAQLVSITSVSQSAYSRGGYRELQKWTYDDGTVEYHTVTISVA